MLTKKDLIALKKCNAVVFRTENGKSQMEAILNVSDDNPFEQRHNILVYSSGAQNAVCVESSLSYAPEITSVLGLLKEGDEPYLIWYKGAWNSERLQKADLIGDALYLQWQREKKYFKFLIHVQISNVQYRMIKS